MAVPGRVTSPTSRGTHALIRDGAALVEGWTDVVAQLPARWRECVGDARAGPAGGEALDDVQTRSGGEAEALLEVIEDEPLTMDAVSERSGLASGRTAALLLELELAGRVRRLEGERFVQVGRGTSKEGSR
jgi:DNA processing protein